MRRRNFEYWGSGTKLRAAPALTKVAVAEIGLLWSPMAAQSALPVYKLLVLRYLQMCYSACQNLLSMFGFGCLFFFFKSKGELLAFVGKKHEGLKQC